MNLKVYDYRIESTDRLMIITPSIETKRSFRTIRKEPLNIRKYSISVAIALFIRHGYHGEIFNFVVSSEIFMANLSVKEHSRNYLCQFQPENEENNIVKTSS